MAEFFPRKTIAWTQIEEPPAFRRLTLSVVEMAVLTGVVIRLVRSLVLTQGSSSLLFLISMFALGAILLFGALTAHLGNYTIRHWIWRAPTFAVIEWAAEMATSAALIAVHREPLGSGRAEFSDLPQMALVTLTIRLGAVIFFAMVLAGVVQAIRYALLKKENRLHTAEAIRHSAEHRAP